MKSLIDLVRSTNLGDVTDMVVNIQRSQRNLRSRIFHTFSAACILALAVSRVNGGSGSLGNSQLDAIALSAISSDRIK